MGLLYSLLHLLTIVGDVLKVIFFPLAVTWTLVSEALASDRTTHLLTERCDRLGAVVRRTGSPS